MKKIVFKNVQDERIRAIFKKVADRYPLLKKHTLILRKGPIGKTTMRAQPVLFSYFGNGAETFKVEISDNTNLADQVSIHKLQDDILYGWFAHELGHVVDYLNRNLLQMIWFGIKYFFSHAFRKKVEHRADEIAIEYGMAHQILATKKYILNHADLPAKYKLRIRRYYMSVDDVHAILAKGEAEELLEEDVHLL